MTCKLSDNQLKLTENRRCLHLKNLANTQHRIGKSRAEVHSISFGSLLGCGSGLKILFFAQYKFCILVLHSADPNNYWERKEH